MDILEEQFLAVPLICFPSAAATHFYSKYFLDTNDF